jgi:hypothetical protein
MQDYEYADDPRAYRRERAAFERTKARCAPCLVLPAPSAEEQERARLKAQAHFVAIATDALRRSPAWVPSRVLGRAMERCGLEVERVLSEAKRGL